MMTNKMDALLGIKAPYLPPKAPITYKKQTNTANSYHGAYNASFKQISEYTLVRTIWHNGKPAEYSTHYDLSRINIIEIRKLAFIRMIFLQEKLEEKAKEMKIRAEFEVFEDQYNSMMFDYFNKKFRYNIMRYNLRRKIDKLLEIAESKGFDVF